MNAERTSTMPMHTHPTPPLLVRIPLIVLSVAVFALFGWSSYAASLGTEAFVWAAVGFSLIGMASCLFGVLLGLGKFQGGFGLAGLCVAGAALTCGVLGWLDLRANLASTPELARLLRPWLAATAACGLGLAGVTGLAVLLRSKSSWAYVLSGLATLAIPVGIVLAFRGPAGSYFDPGTEGLDAIRVALLLLLAFVTLATLSVGGHLVIRAFEVGRSPRGATPKTPSSPGTAVPEKATPAAG